MTFSFVYIIISIMTRNILHTLHFQFESISSAVYFQHEIVKGASFKELKKYLKEQHNKSVPIAEVKKLVLMIAANPCGIRIDKIEEIRPKLQQRIKELF